MFTLKHYLRWSFSVLRHLSIGQLTQQFQLNSDQHFTGELLVHSSSSNAGRSGATYSWNLYFLLGRLVWVSSRVHRFRRWRRAIRLFAPQLNPDDIQFSGTVESPFMEYAVMMGLVRQQQLHRNQAIAIVEHLICEVIFDILQEGDSCEAIAAQSEHLKAMGEPITILNPRQLLTKAYQQWQSWCDAELARYSPHLAPYIGSHEELQKRVSPKAYGMLSTLIDGKATLADLAVTVKQPPLKLTQSLTPYFRKGLLNLRLVPDLLPQQLREVLAEQTAKRPPKVLCIDDSPAICRQLETILKQSGYQCVSLQDPLQAIPSLLEEKPDLIFLDLVMPIASGYEICSQIRRISIFKDTPVVILTGNDGLVDRVRAKMVGASDFLAKPVNPKKVMEVTRRYCPKQQPDAQATTQHHYQDVSGQALLMLP